LIRGIYDFLEWANGSIVHPEKASTLLEITTHDMYVHEIIMSSLSMLHCPCWQQ